ncbi:hypothetical protein B566_EDAN011444 [Ephemera danica]|nr:hypothetical protein B566_EDAN011444 [Ephemera danica]
MANMTTQSLVSTFGLLFGDALHSMGQETTGAALVLNVMSAISNLSGLITGPVIRRFSFRKVALAGGVLFSSGIFLASSATSMMQLIFSFSLLSGLGLGLMGPAGFVAISTYFSKRRGRAVGLALVGTGLGQMLMPQAVRALLDYYGFQGAMLLIGAASLHGIFGASLYQPVERHMPPQNPPPPDVTAEVQPEDSAALLAPDVTKDVRVEEETVVVANTPGRRSEGELHKTVGLRSRCSEGELGGLLRVTPPDLRVLRRLSSAELCSNLDLDVLCKLEDEEDEFEVDIAVVVATIPQETQVVSRGKKRREKLRGLLGSCWGGVVDAMDLNMFLDPVFVNIVVGLAVFHVTNINFSMVFPFFILNLGLTKADAALCMSVTAAADIVARLTVPWLTDRVKAVGSRNTLLVSMTLLAAIRSLIVEQTELRELVWISLFCGFTRGAAVLNLNLSIAEYCCIDKLPAALGINMVLKFFAILSIGPFLGWLRDATDSYPICVHTQSLLLILVAITWFLEIIIRWYRRRHSSEQDESTEAANQSC